MAIVGVSMHPLLVLFTTLSTGLVLGWIQFALLAAAAAAKLASKKKANDKAKEAILAADESARARHAVDEKRRIATLNYLARGAAANNFSDIQVSPEMLAERPYTGPDPVTPSNAADVFDTLGDVAGGAASIYQQGQDKKASEGKFNTWMCMAYPSAPGCAAAKSGAGPGTPMPTTGSSNVGGSLPDLTGTYGDDF